MSGTAAILRADARAIPLPDASVDLVVTSPPYFALRSYTDGGEHYGAQIGAEPTPREYIASLIDCTREWMRVLKPGGSIWVNLGDSYYSGKGAPGRTTVDDKSEARTSRRAGGNPLDGPSFGVGRKSLVLLPERYRIAAVDELGLIARAVVIWSKPNGLPESVTDRVRRSHEDWVHLTKAPRYYSAVDEIRTPAVRDDARASGRRYSGHIPGIGRKHQGLAEQPDHPLGSLPGSVWEIATEPLKVPEHLGIDHFAAFPTEWPRRIILGWSPSGICVACGEGRRPVASSIRPVNQDKAEGRVRAAAGAISGGTARSTLGNARGVPSTVITGEACDCPDATAPTRPAVVLDPFGGTGTTALMAKVLGRHGISVDRSADYCRLAGWRTTDPGQLAKAMRVTAPAKEFAGQSDLLELFPAEMAS